MCKIWLGKLKERKDLGLYVGSNPLWTTKGQPWSIRTSTSRDWNRRRKTKVCWYRLASGLGDLDASSHLVCKKDNEKPRRAGADDMTKRTVTDDSTHLYELV